MDPIHIELTNPAKDAKVNAQPDAERRTTDGASNNHEQHASVSAISSTGAAAPPSPLLAAKGLAGVTELDTNAPPSPSPQLYRPLPIATSATASATDVALLDTIPAYQRQHSISEPVPPHSPGMLGFLKSKLFNSPARKHKVLVPAPDEGWDLQGLSRRGSGESAESATSGASTSRGRRRPRTSSGSDQRVGTVTRPTKAGAGAPPASAVGEHESTTKEDSSGSEGSEGSGRDWDKDEQHDSLEGSYAIGKSVMRQVQHNQLAQKQSYLLLLEFKCDGSHQFREMRRLDILKEIDEVTHAAPLWQKARSGRSGMRKSSSVEDFAAMSDKATEGRPTPQWSNISRGAHNQMSLRARDLRKVDPAFSMSTQPIVLVRRQSICVNMHEVKAIILREKCFVFVPEGADSLLGVLMERLRKAPDDLSLPFEFRVMEALLITICTCLAKELEEIKPNSRRCLGQIVKGCTPARLEALRKLKRNVDVFKARLSSCQKALSETLEEDEDLARMYLTEVFMNREAEKAIVEGNFDHSEMEILLEVYLQEIDTMTISLKLVEKDIENTESLITISLDTARNGMLKTELMLTSVTMCVGFGSLVAGFFGMNLTNGWEHHSEETFDDVVTTTTLGMSGMFLFVVIVLYKLRVLTNST